MFKIRSNQVHNPDFAIGLLKGLIPTIIFVILDIILFMILSTSVVAKKLGVGGSDGLEAVLLPVILIPWYAGIMGVWAIWFIFKKKFLLAIGFVLGVAFGIYVFGSLVVLGLMLLLNYISNLN